jgi:hypothetical protein
MQFAMSERPPPVIEKPPRLAVRHLTLKRFGAEHNPRASMGLWSTYTALHIFAHLAVAGDLGGVNVYHNLSPEPYGFCW